MLQLEAEERVGFVQRFAAQLARSREDAAYGALTSAFGGGD